MSAAPPSDAGPPHSDPPQPAAQAAQEAASPPVAAGTAPASPAPRTRLRRALRFSLELLAILAIVSAVGMWRARSVVATGVPPPPTVLQSLDGQSVDLAQFRGRPMVIRFWATWCGACKIDHPAVQAVANALDDPNGPVLVTIVADGEDPAAVRAFAAEREMDLPILLAGPRTTQDWGVQMFPTDVYVAPDGCVVLRDTGITSRVGMRVRLAYAGLRRPCAAGQDAP